MNYTTSDRSAVSPDGRVVLPLDHPEVLQFLEGGGVIGEEGMLDLRPRPRDELQEQIDFIRWVVGDLQEFRSATTIDAEPPPLSPDPVRHMIPDEIRSLMEEGESLSNAKRRLTELLWVEQAELRNLRGTDRENLKREAEIERLLGLFARLGEI